MSFSSVTRFKRCSKCKVEYPRTFQFFHREKSGSNRLHSRCRLCRQRGNSSKAARLTSLFCPPGFRVCTKCAEVKPAIRRFFHGNKKGLRTDCAECNTDRVKAYYQDNREEIIRKTVEYQRGSPRRIAYMAEYLPKWHELHPTYRRDRIRRYREEKRRDPEWRVKELASRRAYQAKRLAMKAASGGEYTADEILQMYDDQEGLCAYCETPLFGTYHVDHMVPISRGGSSYWTNLAIACPTCNIRKHSKTAEEFWLVLCS